MLWAFFILLSRIFICAIRIVYGIFTSVLFTCDCCVHIFHICSMLPFRGGETLKLCFAFSSQFFFFLVGISPVIPHPPPDNAFWNFSELGDCILCLLVSQHDVRLIPFAGSLKAAYTTTHRNTGKSCITLEPVTLSLLV